MPVLKKEVKGVLKCFNVEGNKRRRNYGMTCNRFLMKANSNGELAGWIKCPNCGAIYDIKDGYAYLIKLTKKEK